MERTEAKQKISQLIGQDLRALANKYDVTVFKDGRKNKGWAGHVIERHLDLQINSSRSPNFGSWELKVIPLKKLAKGNLTVKETMAITMIDAHNIKETNFNNSHLKLKMDRMLIVARIWENKKETSSQLYGAYEFNLQDSSLYEQIEADYNLVRDTIIEKGLGHLTGKMGVYIQPRTKGPGHGSVSRAFYARTGFLKKLIIL